MKLVVVRVRGPVRVRHDFVIALKLLGLFKVNNCVVVEKNPAVIKSLEKVKNFVTWGPVDAKVFAELEKRGGRVVRLHPPRKGYARKGVKLPFKLGGALGDRGEKINDLILRML